MHDLDPRSCTRPNPTHKALTTQKFYVPSAKKSSVEQASAAVQTEQTTHSYSSLNHALPLIVVHAAVVAHVSVTAAAAGINVTCSWLTANSSCACRYVHILLCMMNCRHM